MRVTIAYHFTAPSFFMKCECVLSGHCIGTDPSLCPSLGLTGSVLLVLATVRVVVAVVVEIAVEVVVAVAAVAQVMLVVMADTIFVPIAMALVPVQILHLKRSSFR